MNIDEEILTAELNHKGPMSHQEFMRRCTTQERFTQFHRAKSTLTQEMQQSAFSKFKADWVEYDDWKLNRPPEIYEQVHDYPKSWKCPNCQKTLDVEAMRYNSLSCENICCRCGEPQRQFATRKWKDGMKPKPESV